MALTARCYHDCDVMESYAISNVVCMWPRKYEYNQLRSVLNSCRFNAQYSSVAVHSAVVTAVRIN